MKNGGTIKISGRLHRSATEKKVAGVCGGIAEYLNADPVVVRLAWALLCLGWGTGIVIYLLLAFILPEEKATDFVSNSKQETTMNIDEAVE